MDDISITTQHRELEQRMNLLEDLVERVATKVDRLSRELVDRLSRELEDLDIKASHVESDLRNLERTVNEH